MNCCFGINFAVFSNVAMSQRFTTETLCLNQNLLDLVRIMDHQPLENHQAEVEETIHLVLSHRLSSWLEELFGVPLLV